MKILVIGGGNMGMTYAQSILRSKIANRKDMMILEKFPKKAEELAKQEIGTVYGNPDECMSKADLIILAVKPQDIKLLFENIKPFVDPQQVFISIMAGVTIKTISTALGVKKVIRAMPNLPAQVGMGMTAFTSTDDVTRIELVMVQNLLNTTGKTVYVDTEKLIDSTTAISGSGPAYVYYFMDAMMTAAKQLGFSNSEAELLVSQTFKGAVDLYNKSDLTCEEWIAKVSSKGGTTEAAIKSYRDNKVHKDIIDGAKAAFNRALELGKGKA